jgi:outer membrane murein-binding lipoprotein Lpp
MSAVRCPSCRLPLTDEEANGGSCSSCGHELPRIEAPEPKTKAAPTASHDPAVPWLAAGVSLLIAIVAVAWGLTHGAGPAEIEGAVGPAKIAKLETDLETYKAREYEQLERVHTLEAELAKIASDKDAARVDSTVANAKLDLTAKDMKEAEAKLAAAKAEIDRLQQEAKQMRDALAGKGDFMQPGVVKEIRNGPNDKTLVLSSPRGDFTIDRLVNGSKIKLSGVVKRLIVQGVDGGSHLDASFFGDFKAEEIRFTGPIAGNSIVKIVSAGANVTLGRIDGDSTVTLRVLGGKVSVDEVVGDSKLLVWTKDFALKAFADGGKTGLNVTLTREGHLSFGELRGASKLIVQKFDRGDPDVRIEAGKVGPNAVFKKLAF